MTAKEIAELKTALNGRRFFSIPTVGDIIKILVLVVGILVFVFGIKADVESNAKAIESFKECSIEKFTDIKEDIKEIKEDVKELLRE